MKNECFVLASHNKAKLAEMRDILGELGIRVISQAEAGVDVEPEETGTTFEENALIKARAVMEASRLPAVADDSAVTNSLLIPCTFTSEPISHKITAIGTDASASFQLPPKNSVNAAAAIR